jgi:hypothetical protein
MGRKEEAIEQFNKVLEINPKNVVAEREVRIERIRADSASKKGAAGLASKLFGKKDG